MLPQCILQTVVPFTAQFLHRLPVRPVAVHCTGFSVLGFLPDACGYVPRMTNMPEWYRLALTYLGVVPPDGQPPINYRSRQWWLTIGVICIGVGLLVVGVSRFV